MHLSRDVHGDAAIRLACRAEARKRGPGIFGAGRQQSGGSALEHVLRWFSTGHELPEMPFDEASIDITRNEGGIGGGSRKEGCVRPDRPDLQSAARRRELCCGRFAGGRSDDQLGDHRIIIGCDLSAFLHAAVDADARRKAQAVERAGRRQKSRHGILGIEARFHRPAIDHQLILTEGQGLATGDAQLPLDQILAGDRFCHRMLDLKSRIHLHEPDAIGAQAFAGIGDELDSAGADIVDGLRCFHRSVTDRRARDRIHAGGGGLLDDLLVPTLQRAVALEQVNHVALRVAKNLDLDVTGSEDIFLDQHLVVAEGRRGFPLT